MFQLTLLGGATVEDASGAPTGLVLRRHPLALLALLATAPFHTLSRGKLVGLLWPDSPEQTARNRLNTYVHLVRKELGEDVLVSVGDDLRLDPAVLACDVCQFQEALEGGDYDRAVELYGGPLLDGFQVGASPAFEQRVDQERARLERGYHEALEALAEQAEEGNDSEVAAGWWRQRASEDPYDSRVVCRLMRALEKAGNPAGALRVAHEHARLLEEDFHARPSTEMQALVRALQEASQLEAKEVGASAEFGRASARETDYLSTGESGDGGEWLAGPPSRAQDAARPRFAPRARSRTPLAGVISMGLVGAAGVAVWYLLGAGGSVASRVGDRSIAVLPFRSLGEEEVSAFTQGLHSDVSTRLSSIAGLEVVSRESVMQFRDTERPLREIARSLGVTWVLAAEVQTAGDEVHVNARLVNARSDRQIWAYGYQ